MATIEEISALLDKKLVTLRQQITEDIENKLQEKIEENVRNIAGNAVTIEGHSQQLQTLKEEHRVKVQELEDALKKQADELDEQIKSLNVL